MDCRKICFLLIPLIVFASQETYWNEGANEAGQILNDYKTNLSARVNNPITNGQKLYTLDNSQSGSVSIDCGEEYKILKITYSPQGGGDINLQIQTDFNLNNVFDKTFYFNGISGVCSNGVIKCSPGTWNDCKYYQFQFNGSAFSLKEVSSSQLDGCYCVNNSCGDVYTNYSQVLSTISGALSGILNHTYYIISNTQIERNTAYVYGKSINCGGESVPAGMSETELESKAQEEKTSPTYTLLYQTTQNVDKNSSVDESYKNNLLNTYSNVQQSANYNAGTYSYQDGSNKVSGSIFVGNVENAEYCEVEWTAKDTQAYSDNTNKATSTSSATTEKSEIIECKKDSSGNWYCPVAPGQKIKHDCGKVDDFGELVGALSGINNAVKDFTCSKE